MSPSQKLRARPQHATVKDLDVHTSQRSTCDATPWTKAERRRKDGDVAVGCVLLILGRHADTTSAKSPVIPFHPSTWNAKVGESRKTWTSCHTMPIDVDDGIDAAAAAAIKLVMSRPRLATAPTSHARLTRKPCQPRTRLIASSLALRTVSLVSLAKSPFACVPRSPLCPSLHKHERTALPKKHVCVKRILLPDG